ncbi:Tetratricopeptide repeat [Plasmodiophora brassicae]|nr:hypothetical protein PBRA_007244 [Plasmodiophora brassicae]
MTNQERIAEQVDIARRLKDEGNDLLRSGDLQKAAAKYSKMFLYIRGFDYTKTAAAMLPDQPAPAAPDDNMQREIDGLIRSANLNLSFCYLKLNEPDKAKKFATAVLDRDASNVKALFRRGCAYEMLGELGAAEEDWKRAHELQPSDRAIVEKMKLCRQRDAAQMAETKKRMAGMFDRAAKSAKST